MPSYALVLLVVSLLVVLGVGQNLDYKLSTLPLSAPTEDPQLGDAADSPLTWDIECEENDVVPSTCLAVQNGNKCSCKILDKKWVMVLSGCINPYEGSQIKVHAGAPTDKSARQIVSATIFLTPEPPPLDVQFLQLQTPLNQTSEVQPAYLTMQYINDKFGYLSGYRQETNGAYYSKCYKAHILDGICNVDELCAFEREKNSWPAVTRDEGTDFLDFYNEETGIAYFVGVRRRQETPGFIAYQRILIMFPWMDKYLR